MWKFERKTNPDLKLYLDEISAKIGRKCEKVKKSVFTKEQKDSDLWEAGSSRCAKITRTNEWRQRTDSVCSDDEANLKHVGVSAKRSLVPNDTTRRSFRADLHLGHRRD